MTVEANQDFPSKISRSGKRAKMVHIVDHDWERRRYRVRLLRKAGYHLTCHADGAHFIAEMENLPPGCVLLTPRMERMNGLEILRCLSGKHATLPVVMVSGDEDFETAIQSMKLGARDFVLEREGSDGQRIISAVEEALSDLSRELSDAEERRAAAAQVAILSPREKDVLRGLYAGMRNKEIAEYFKLSIRTVEMHRAHMMEKLLVARLSEALHIASKVDLEPLAPAA